MKINEIIKNNPKGFSILVKKNNNMIKPTLLNHEELKKECKYIVSITNNKINKNVLHEIETNFKLLLNFARMISIDYPLFIGFWSNEGKNYLDLSIGLNNKHIAEALRLIFNQLEIYTL